MNRLLLPQVSNKLKNAANTYKNIPSLGIWNNQIKMIREALGMTQGQVAKRLKSTQQQFSSIESGKVNPTIKTLAKIAKIMNCTLHINFVPNEDISKTVTRRAEKKIDDILNMSIANAALEGQKPGKMIIKEQKRYLLDKLINENRSSLWED